MDVAASVSKCIQPYVTKNTQVDVLFLNHDDYKDDNFKCRFVGWCNVELLGVVLTNDFFQSVMYTWRHGIDDFVSQRLKSSTHLLEVNVIGPKCNPATTFAGFANINIDSRMTLTKEQSNTIASVLEYAQQQKTRLDGKWTEINLRVRSDHSLESLLGGGIHYF